MMTVMLRAALSSWVDAVGLRVDDDAWSRLDALVALWRRYGPALNLLGAYDDAALVEHVREALAARRAAEQAAGATVGIAWLDVGSGGGLPGLVVAATTDWVVALIEPRAKRAAFLELAAARVGRGSARVARARIGDPTWGKDRVLHGILGADHAILIASARAVFEPETWLNLARRAFPPRAIVVVHVGSDAADVAGEVPAARVEAGRWAALAYRGRAESDSGS